MRKAGQALRTWGSARDSLMPDVVELQDAHRSAKAKAKIEFFTGIRLQQKAMVPWVAMRSSTRSVNQNVRLSRGRAYLAVLSNISFEDALRGAVGPQRKLLSVRERVQLQRAPDSCSKMSIIGRFPGGAMLSESLTSPCENAGQASRNCCDTTPVWPSKKACAGAAKASPEPRTRRANQFFPDRTIAHNFLFNRSAQD